MSQEPAHESRDVIVVGGSFAGLAAAMQLARARRRVLVIDAGRPRNRFAAESHGFLGQDGRPPADILADARAQLFAYPTAECVQGEAVEARASGDLFEVTLGSGERFRARRLVLAVGVADELPAVQGLTERWGKTVLHCPYCHGFEVADGRLGVLASTEHSVRQALLVRDWSPSVTLFTAGAIALTDEQRAALAARGVAVEEREVAAVTGEVPALDGLRLADGSHVPLDALFVAPRVRPASPLAEQLGCEHEEGPMGPFVRTDALKATSVNGVWAAGDTSRAMHNVSLAVADGALAGIAAHQSLALG